MAPFTMRCSTCGEYIYQRKKFNARKETVRGEDYLGIDIFRFFIKCPKCASEITFKTDPQNTDYVCEHGAVRNFEPWRDEKFIEKELNDAEDADLEANPMKALEKRTMESKREMEILEQLDDIRTGNARGERVSIYFIRIDGKVDLGEVLERIVEERLKKDIKEKDDEELRDDEIARNVFMDASGEGVKRALDEEEFELVDKMKEAKANVHKRVKPASDLDKLRSEIVLKRMPKVKAVSLGLVGYASDSD